MNDSTGLVAGLITVVVIVLIYLWAALALGAVFRKAGEDAWQAWVPILNTAVLLRLGGFSPWLVFIVFVPLFGWIALPVILVISYFRINRAFGFGVGMTVLAAFVPLVWASIVGFGSARWIGDETAGPRRSGEREADAAAIPRVGPFDVFEPLVPPSAAPSPHGVAPTAAAAPASSATGFWAPPPVSSPPASPGVSSPSVATPPVSPAPVSPRPVSPPPASSPVVPLPVPPAPVSFLATRADARAEQDSAVDPEDRIAPPARASSTFLPPPPASSNAESSDASSSDASTSEAEHEAEPRRRTPDPVAPIASVPTVAPRPEPEAPPVVPVADVPEAPAAVPEPEPWAPAPLRTPPPVTHDPEHFPELSEAISAVAGAPDAGAPRSARSSVSALYAEAEIPTDDEDDLDAMDQTIVARRRRVPWTLIPPGGAPVDISSEVVILGRRPSPDPARPGAQLISISDETRTVSKTHARLELRGETWFVTDLGSTNGVLFATLMGTEVEAQPGQELEAGERFFLGDAEVRLKRSDA